MIVPFIKQNSTISPSLTRGIVGDVQFHVLPNISPLQTLLFTIAFQIVSFSFKNHFYIFSPFLFIYGNILHHVNLYNPLFFVVLDRFFLVGMFMKRLF